MKERIFFNFIWCIVFSIILIVGIMFYKNFERKDMGTSDSVLKSTSLVEDYLKSKYSGYCDKKNITVSGGREHKNNSNNHSQTYIRNYYNSNNGRKKDIPNDNGHGVCWAAACTSLLEYYKAEEKDYRRIGYVAIRHAVNKKWITADDTGLDFSRSDSLVNYLLYYYDLENKYKANNDRYDIYDELVDQVDDGNVVLFSIKGHEMVGCGYVNYKVKYKKKNIWGKWNTKTATQKFVIVNDTWTENSTRQYSYFPECEIGTNISSRWDFGITKVVKK